MWGINFRNIIMSSVLACALPAFPGAISGGGGGTVPVNPATEDEVLLTLANARGVLTLIFKDMSQLHVHGGDIINPIYEDQLFDGPRTIFDVLKEGKIEILRDRPCLDPNGNEVDGSAPGSEEHSVCISTYRIVPKVTEDNYEPQTLALVAHEFSHLIGFSEAQAVALQKRIVATMRASSGMLAVGFLGAAQMANEELNTDLLLMDAYTKQAKLSLLAQTSRELMHAFNEFRNDSYPYSVLNGSEKGLESEYVVKSYNLYLWSCAQGAGDPLQKHSCEKQYAQAFQEAHEYTAREAAKHFGLPPPWLRSVDHRIMIRKIEDFSSFKQELAELSDYIIAKRKFLLELRSLLQVN